MHVQVTVQQTLKLYPHIIFIKIIFINNEIIQL